MNKINLIIDAEGWKLDKGQHLLEWLTEEWRIENKISGTINLVLVDAMKIAEMNETWLNHEGVTDVIAFQLEDDEMVLPEREMDANEEESISGEIYICIERALEQAVDYEVTIEEELGRLALHGLLHLNGWDDQSDSEKQSMRNREDEGLARKKKSSGIGWSVRPPIKQ